MLILYDVIAPACRDLKVHLKKWWKYTLMRTYIIVRVVKWTSVSCTVHLSPPGTSKNCQKYILQVQYPRNTTEFTSSLHVGLACIEIYGRCDGSWTKKTEPKWNHFYIIQFILSEAPGGWHKEFPVTFDDGPSQIISIILDRVQISWMRHDYYFHNAWCVIFLLDFRDWWISLGWDLFLYCNKIDVICDG